VVLSQTSIEAAIKQGRISIEPFTAANLKEASYSFSLQDELTLQPGEFVVVLTKEKISLAKDMCCFLSTRGSIAQQGIDALQSSFFVEPLSANQLKLEIKNNSSKSVTLEAGIPIVKGIFMKVD